MPRTARIGVRAVRHGVDFVPSLLAGRSPVSLEVSIQSAGEVPPHSMLVARGREIFSGTKTEWSCPLSELPWWGESLRLDLGPDRLAPDLRPEGA